MSVHREPFASRVAAATAPKIDPSFGGEIRSPPLPGMDAQDVLRHRQSTSSAMC
jgi:hypothetical protein